MISGLINIHKISSPNSWYYGIIIFRGDGECSNIMDAISTIITSLGGSAVLSGTILALIQTRMTKRWDHRYNQQLEEIKTKHQNNLEIIKSKLQSNQEIIKTSISNLASNNQKLLEKQLIAVDDIWKSMLELRDFSQGTVMFYSVFLPTEYHKVLQTGNKIWKINRLDQVDINEFLASHCEHHRPYIGEYIWGLFGLYRGFVLRVQYLFDNGYLTNEVKPWFNDEHLIEMARSCLGAEQFEEIDFTKLGSLNESLSKMEQKILFEIDKLITGENFAQKNIQEAKKIMNIVNEEYVNLNKNVNQNAIKTGNYKGNINTTRNISTK